VIGPGKAAATAPPCLASTDEDFVDSPHAITKERIRPMWTKPSYTDMRIGFEVTLYFANR
jgi:pyrroloquinoline quinone biosynthesis protein A